MIQFAEWQKGKLPIFTSFHNGVHRFEIKIHTALILLLPFHDKDNQHTSWYIARLCKRFFADTIGKPSSPTSKRSFFLPRTAVVKRTGSRTR